jgi:hypothetical protein
MSDEKKEKEGGIIGGLKGIEGFFKGIEESATKIYEMGGKTSDFNTTMGLINGVFNGVDGLTNALLHTPYAFILLPAYILKRISADEIWRTMAMAGLVGIGTWPILGAANAVLAADFVLLGKLLETKATRKPTIAALLGAVGGAGAATIPQIATLFGSPLTAGAKAAILAEAFALREELDKTPEMARINAALGLNKPAAAPSKKKEAPEISSVVRDDPLFGGDAPGSGGRDTDGDGDIDGGDDSGDD